MTRKEMFDKKGRPAMPEIDPSMAERWEEEAKRYTQNADYWRVRAFKAEEGLRGVVRVTDFARAILANAADTSTEQLSSETNGYKPYDGRDLAETFIKELDLYMSHKIAEERKTPGMSGRSASIDRSRAKLVEIFEVIENACYAAKVR